MKIHHNVISSLPRLYTQNQDNNQRNNQLKMETGPTLPGHDSVEISEAAKRLAEGISDRQLPVDAMEHDWIRPFFTDEIDTSLQQLLDGKSPEVEAAVNFLISSNFVPDGSVPNDNERAALLEIGLTQAQYIADNYMTDEEADEFLATMNRIAAYAITRTVDPETGQASYIEIPRKPKGAPDDYVDINYLMKKHDPESAHTITDILKDALNGGSITGFNELLQGFIQKMAQNPQW